MDLDGDQIQKSRRSEPGQGGAESRRGGTRLGKESMRPRPSRRVNLPAPKITGISQKSETEQKRLARVFVMVYMTEKRGVRGQRCNLN